MKLNLFKSKVLTGALALAMTVAMVPSMAMAEDAVKGTSPELQSELSLQLTALGEPVINNGWSTFQYGGVSVSISTDVEKIQFVQYPAVEGENEYHIVDNTNFTYFPKHFSMKISPQSEVTATNGASFQYYNAPYGVVTMGTEPADFTITNGNTTIVVHCPAPYGEATVGTGPVAYLPGYGQFANEGVNQGGWGDAYTNDTAGRKAMMNAISPTGISLGSFGGYAIFDFGENGVANDPKNKYGVDFIVYGNAFVGNAEPGGIQVSQDGTTWYNIAGSRHYANSTVWDYTVTHTNKVPTDDDIEGTREGKPFTGEYKAATKSKARPNSAVIPGEYQIKYNTWHEHNWFPLYGNYFKIRKAGELPLANLSLAEQFATYTPKTGDAASKLELKGTKIDFTSMSGNDYTFGYCDVHPNGNTPGVASNPYTAVAGTAGGDGIDISWAVNADGEPVNLDNIRYVRIYTGVMKDNPPFGETSTEVCGVYNVNPQATAVGVAYQSSLSDGENTYEPVSVDGSNTQGMTLIQQEPGTMVYNIAAEDVADLYLNGIKVEENEVRIGNMIARFDGKNLTVEVSLGENDTQYLQIITQPNGDEEAYINLVKFTSN